MDVRGIPFLPQIPLETTNGNIAQLRDTPIVLVSKIVVVQRGLDL
jgi:hypothetical protein